MELRETRLAEARYDRSGKEVTLTIIRPGFNKSRRRFYPAETLRRDYRVFEGAKMFVDHATTREERERPEGSVRDWVASVKRLWVDGDGTIRATAAVPAHRYRPARRYRAVIFGATENLPSRRDHCTEERTDHR